MKSFKELGISGRVLESIGKMGFSSPTEIQEKTIPIILSGKDIIAGSATGSGKTLAFGSCMVQMLENRHRIGALVLVPTRELAVQVSDVISKLSKADGIKVCAIYGGVSIEPQIRDLKDAEIVIGTPGRILDHLQRRTINLSYVNMLVLDEADRMLDMGFIDDVMRIMSKCPRKRQNMLFSATIGPEIERLAARHMNSPVKVSAVAYVDPTKLAQFYYDVRQDRKISLLIHLLKKEKEGVVMVFCNSRRSVDFVAKNLQEYGVDAIAIHGGFSQDKRTKTIESFSTKTARVLVCTDVAARGLDIQGVSHVYNYEIPKESKQYIHRIGRTARAGKSGKAVNLLSHLEHGCFSRIIRDHKLDIVKKETPDIEKIRPVRPDRSDSGMQRPGRGFGRGKFQRKRRR